jgi:osmoprotectant transport system substrate-binding protein
MTRRILLACVLVTALATVALGAKGPVVVGSKIDTEGALLGNMIIIMLEDEGFETVDKTEFGTTPIVRKAMINGQIDIYPEYTGNGAFFFEGTDPDVWKDPDKGYATVKRLDANKNGIIWLQPAPANNTWAVAARGDLADKEDLVTLEDFADYVRAGKHVKLAGCEEFVNRADALPSFQEAYGFELDKDQLLVFSGCNTSQTEKAAAQGTSGVNFAMAFGTDGALSALGLVVLEDTKGVQPVYEPAPVVRREIIEKHPSIRTVLAPVFKSLDLRTLQRLNSRIAISGRPAGEVAREYLEQEGFIK